MFAKMFVARRLQKQKEEVLMRWSLRHVLHKTRWFAEASIFDINSVNRKFPISFPDRECPELTQPELGAVIMSGREFGGLATYSCPHGYNVVGLQSRLCRNGHWTGVEPTFTQNSTSRIRGETLDRILIFFIFIRFSFLQDAANNRARSSLGSARTIDLRIGFNRSISLPHRFVVSFDWNHFWLPESLFNTTPKPTKYLTNN